MFPAEIEHHMLMSCRFTQASEGTAPDASATSAQGSTVRPSNVPHGIEVEAEPWRRRPPPGERRQAASCRASIVEENVRTFAPHQVLQHDHPRPQITALPQLACSSGGTPSSAAPALEDICFWSQQVAAAGPCGPMGPCA